MKYLAVVAIFWLAIWTNPKSGDWWYRVAVMAWAVWLQWKILNNKNEKL